MGGKSPRQGPFAVPASVASALWVGKEGVHPPKTDVDTEDIHRFQEVSVSLEAVEQARRDLHSKLLDVKIAEAGLTDAEVSLRCLQEEYERRLRDAQSEVERQTIAVRSERARASSAHELLLSTAQSLQQRVSLLLAGNSLLNLLPMSFCEELRSQLMQVNAGQPTGELKHAIQRLEDNLDAAMLHLRETALCPLTAEPARLAGRLDEPQALEGDRAAPIASSLALQSYAYVSPEQKEKLRVNIRWMIRGDMPEVLEIEKESFAYPWREEDFFNCLRQPNHIGMVAEYRNQILGFIIYRLDKRKLYILNLAVHPAHRHQDIGTQMVKKLVSKLSNHYCTHLTVEVGERNLPAQQFFRTLGFQAIKVLRGYYKDVGQDAYLLCYLLPGAEKPREEEMLEEEGAK